MLAMSPLSGAEARRVEVTPEYVMAIDKSPQPEWIIARPGDMRLAESFTFDFYVDDPSTFVSYQINFRSGDGRYCGVFEPGEPGRWNHVVVRKSDCSSTIGDVAGWGNVTCVTIGGQYGLDTTARFHIANVGLLPINPGIIVVRGDSCVKAFKWDRHDRLACTMARFLEGMGVPVTQLSDLDVSKGIPESTRLLVFPSNPSVPAAAADELARFAARGGRFLACSYVDSRIRGLLGVNTKGFYDRRKDPGKPPVDGIIPTAQALEGAPSFIAKRFNTFIEPVVRPKVRPLAVFADAERKDVGIVALVASPGGFYFGAGWDCWGREARELFRGMLLSVEPTWRDALDRGMAAADRADAADAQWLGSLKPKAGELRSLSCHNEKGYAGLGWAKSVEIAKNGGYNEIVPNVAWANCLFKKEAAECLEACRVQGVKCCLWKVCWRSTKKSTQGIPGRALKDFSGKEDPLWMCPADPANRRSEMEQFMELARMRPDSVEFDYIRYPSGFTCACDGCREMFEAKCGFSITNWNRQVWNNPKVKEQWFAFRREVLTSFVREVSNRIRAECPGMKICAATMRDGETSPNWYGQDWLAWCREGIIDYSETMDYHQGNVAGLRQLLTRQRDLGRGLKGKIIPLLGLNEWTRFGRDAVRLAQEIEVVRELGFDGFGVFQLSERCVETMPALRAGLLASAPPANVPQRKIAPDDGVPPRWEKPQTTRRYLHGPLSERLFTFWREGKLLFAENEHTPDWRLPYSKQAAHGAWLVRGDCTALDFKDARLSVTPDGTPDHSQTWLDGGVETKLSACAPFGRKPSLFARAEFSNKGAEPVEREFLVLLRNATEMALVHSGPDVYAIYEADVGRWLKVPASDWKRQGDTFRSSDRFVAFRPGDGVTMSWDAEKGGARLSVRLKPGETRRVDFTLGRGEEPAIGYDAARTAMKASWAAELSNVVLPEVARRDDGMKTLVRHLAVQMLQCLAMPANGANHVLPRQGGLQRLVWPGESIHVVTALDLLGLSGYADSICDFYWSHCVQDSGEAGPFRNRWAGDTAYVLRMLAQHCATTRNAALWRRHSERAARSFAWIRAGRTGDGLFPPMKSTDSATGLQHWGHTDLVNMEALEWYAKACEMFAEPNAAVARAEWQDYRAVIVKVLDRWREKSKGRDELFLPITATGEREDELVSQGFFYLHPAGFAASGLLSADELVRLRRNLLRRGFANENGLYMRHPSPIAVLGRHIWYTTWSEMQWMMAWLRVGRNDLAEQALQATLRFSVSDEFIVGERYHDVNPWYFPWSPNASGSGRIVRMLFSVRQ